MPTPIGLYVHWPYCARICPYCDFNVYRERGQSNDLGDAILRDLAYWQALSGARTLNSVHFGGGTPSMMPVRLIEKIVSAAADKWQISADTEIALEANPNDITLKRLKDWAAAGINRLSIGVQSFDDGALQFLGRDHDGKAARTAIDQSLAVLPQVSADFIYGYKGHRATTWEEELRAIVKTGLPHISAYQLTIERGTAFGKSATRGAQLTGDAETLADLHELAAETLTTAGYENYEVSNFARQPNARSAHNMLYWTGGDYAGIGPGAHGRLDLPAGRVATVAHKKPQTYIGGGSQGTFFAHKEILTPQARAQERVLMGLRIKDGIAAAELEALGPEHFNWDEIAALRADGLLHANETRLAATRAGQRVLDAVSTAILRA